MRKLIGLGKIVFTLLFAYILIFEIIGGVLMDDNVLPYFLCIILDIGVIFSSILIIKSGYRNITDE